MAQIGRIVGIDVSKLKVDGFIRSLQIGSSQPSTPAGEKKMIAWLRENGIEAAVMEASGGYEKSWATALRAAGIAVRIVDPKRVRHFAHPPSPPPGAYGIHTSLTRALLPNMEFDSPMTLVGFGNEPFVTSLAIVFAASRHHARKVSFKLSLGA
jgi:hypothetical protein